MLSYVCYKILTYVDLNILLQLSPGGVEIQYILIVYEAEDFCKLIINESLPGHVLRVQNHYPSYTVCYLTNKLIAYVRKR